MARRLFQITVVLALLVGAVVATPALAAPPTPQDPQPIYRDDIIDMNPVLEAREPREIAEFEAMVAEADLDLPQFDIQQTTAYTVGDTLTWIGDDELDPMGHTFLYEYFETDYKVMAIREYCEIWVQTDLNYYNEDGTFNPLHPDAKDPMYVTQERVDDLADACNENIRPTDVQFFGDYNDRDGTQGLEALINELFGTHLSEVDGKADRLVILVQNIRDENFYDPVSSTSFIAGLSSGTIRNWGDRNFFFLDSKQWNIRAGDTGHEKAFDYDSTLAHELQHLIHRDHVDNPTTWINEGMSGWAEFLNGYWRKEELGDRTDWQQAPENSITIWGDQPGEILADYQAVNSFMLYTAGRAGGNYTATAGLVEYSEDGILGYSDWLSDTISPDLTFEDIFEGFRRDMLYGGYTDGAQPAANWNANFIHEYESPLEQSGGPPTSRAYVGELRDNLDSEGYGTEGVPPFGSDYIELCWSSPVSQTAHWPVVFDGDENSTPTGWDVVAATEVYTPSGTVAGDVLYSGHTDLTDNFVIFGPITVAAGDELSFDHFYNIEDEWDYGFVQVTTDTTGVTGWTSLEMTGMYTSTDPDAHPVIVANVPGFFGYSGGWVTATHDLGASYAGEDVLLAFRYSTDWGTGGSYSGYPAGWAIDNVQVGATTLTDGSINGRSIGEVRDAGARFAVEFVTWGDGDAITVTNVYTLDLDPATQYGTFDLATLNDPGFDEPGERGVFVVSAMLDPSLFTDLVGGVPTTYADYTLVGLPPSICTSDVDAYGDTHVSPNYVYAGQVVTAEVYLDNLGTSPNITTTGPAMFYVGVELPGDTTYVAGSATNGAAYTDDLSTVAGTFPAVPGVYWTGSVARTDEFGAGFTTAADLIDGDKITVTVHFADAASASPDQHFVDEDVVTVESAFGLSGLMADVDPVWPGTEAQFTASVLNLTPVTKSAQLVAVNPADTTLTLWPSGAVTSTTAITVTQVISPYAEVGAVNFTFKWMLGPSYGFGDVITSTMVLADLATDETFDLDATAKVDAFSLLYLPLTCRSFVGTLGH
jgi:hypothetical protein